MKACEVGGLDAVPMACNARICSVGWPFHHCLTHRLPGAAEKARLKARLQLADEHGRKKESLSAIEHGVGQCTQRSHPGCCAACGVPACLRRVFAAFFGIANAPTDCRYNTSGEAEGARYGIEPRREGRASSPGHDTQFGSFITTFHTL